MHDDYDYGQVNQLLERNLKAYIKTVTCYPERLTKKDYDNVMKEFKHSEKVYKLYLQLSWNSLEKINQILFNSVCVFAASLVWSIFNIFITGYVDND